MKQMIQFPIVRLLTLCLLVLSIQAGVGRAQVNDGPRQLNGEEARRFLEQEGLLELVAPQLPADDHPFVQTATLSADEGVASEGFGLSVALDGDTAVVGAPEAGIDGNVDQGAAYVFTRSGSTWSQQARLVASDGAAEDWFGGSVALDGDTAVVGALGADIDGNVYQGAAYVFTRTGSIWSQQVKLTAVDGAAGDIFGWSVALDGDTAVVGADSTDIDGNENQGAVYVFTRSGSSWNQQAKLIASDGAAGDGFGFSVALDGDTALVGALGVEHRQGAVYVFSRSGSSWSQQEKLAADDGMALDDFGYSVALDGETALVGARYADVGDNANQGAAYIFVHSGSGWNQQDKLVADDGAADVEFGDSVALEGDTAVVGAHRADIGSNRRQGAAYVFTRIESTWNQQMKLIADDGAAGDTFGSSLALDGDTALLGAANANRVYVFEREGSEYLVYLPVAIR